jgi:asparagine synthase (glutamine-hydrolysing)
VCGIAGVLAFDGRGPEAALVARMTAALAHRGPDAAAGLVDGPLALGHRRLSIIDHAGGAQPMANARGTVWIAYNGEVFNFRELRAGLEGRGRVFRTASDTEVVLAMYEEFGVDGFRRLSGMFALAIWDVPQQTLVLARDHLGIKPLYYHRDGRRVAFASEIRALLLDPRLPRRLSLDAVDDYLAFSYVAGEDTIFDGVRRLPPGHVLVCREDGVELVRFWRLEPAPSAHASEDDCIEDLRGRLTRAVERHLIADVPVGVFLSGGLDSSTIAAVVARLGRRDTPTFSIGFAGQTGYFDESADARAVARHFNLSHRTLTVSPDIEALLPRVVDAVEEPIGDPSIFLTYLISRAAREEIRVALTGIGGDELFGGYRRYVGARLAATLHRLPRAIGHGLHRTVSAIGTTEETRFGYYVSAVRRLLDAAREPQPGAYLRTLACFAADTRRRLYTRDVRAALAAHDPAALFREHFARAGADRVGTDGGLAGASGADLLARLFYLDVMTFLPDNLLLFSDKASMAASLELRVPLLDLELVDFAARLPAALRVRGLRTKYLLRKAVAPLLPPTVLAKRKQGFTAPVGQWIRRELAGWADELLSPASLRRRGLLDPAAVGALLAEHRAGRSEWGYQLFALMALELWCRSFIDARTSDVRTSTPTFVRTRPAIRAGVA